MDLEDLLAALSPEEVSHLVDEMAADPDDKHMPASARCVAPRVPGSRVSRVACCRTAYRCEKEPTGELNRDTLINHINEIALNTPDAEEKVKFEAGVKRGKVYVPKYSEEESAEMEKTESGQVTLSNIFNRHCKYFCHFRCGWIPRKRRRCPTPP